ncbi:MAG: tetratricopeptide repeat protein [Elusimicrobia bacterium]|nr:tetratricopeptide repeat protein [Elusimicrobiota bacterium]
MTTKQVLALLIALSAAAPARAADSQAQAAVEAKRGDALAAQEDFKSAADAYLEALSLGKFSLEERMTMATRISWGGRLDEAAREFRAVLGEDPANARARTALARTLSWKGDNETALAEIEAVLSKTPDDREALLVKANVLRLSGQGEAAIALYAKLLTGGEDFDARLGLSYAELARGRKDAARADAASLKPKLPYEERELKELAAALAVASEAKPAAPSVSGVVDLEALTKGLAATSDKDQQALLYKAIGDAYSSKGEAKSAAGAYSKALAQGKFGVEDRMTMATRISWAGRLDEAVKEFRSILSEDPSNARARIALARTLSWKGDNARALAEIDAVLAKSPEDREALLVKANALRGSGRTKDAIVIYNQLLAKGEDFDARSGLCYGLLSSGDRSQARGCAALLKVQYPYQEREARSLQTAIAAGTRPTFDARYSYYEDTDSNFVKRYSLLYGQWFGKWKADLGYSQTEALRSAPTNVAAEVFSAGTYRKLTDSLGAGAGLAMNRTRSLAGTSFMTWNAKADLAIADGSASLSGGSALLTDTAQLIANRIRATSANFYASRVFLGSLILSGAFSHREYSDNNNANDGMVSPALLLLAKNPRITLGYKFRYLGFRRQAFDGYYDPSNYKAHQIFTNISFDASRVYGYVEGYTGWQAEHRNAVLTNSTYSGGSGSIGFRLCKSLSIEGSADGGNFSLESANGFQYYQAGARVVFTP